MIMIMINFVISIPTTIHSKKIVKYARHYYMYYRYILNIQCALLFMFEVIVILII